MLLFVGKHLIENRVTVIFSLSSVGRGAPLGAIIIFTRCLQLALVISYVKRRRRKEVRASRRDSPHVFLSSSPKRTAAALTALITSG